MARAWFVNPNEPEQPARGVYRWFCLIGRKMVTLYVGNAGGREPGVCSPSTLKRGVLEAQRSCISSNQGGSLDTDFIVGTAIRYFKDKGCDCYWQHISDDPRDETRLCRECEPILQRGKEIKQQFRLRKPDGGQWGNGDLKLAEDELFKLFDKYLGQELQQIASPLTAR